LLPSNTSEAQKIQTSNCKSFADDLDDIASEVVEKTGSFCFPLSFHDLKTAFYGLKVVLCNFIEHNINSIKPTIINIYGMYFRY